MTAPGPDFFPSFPAVEPAPDGEFDVLHLDPGAAAGNPASAGRSGCRRETGIAVARRGSNVVTIRLPSLAERREDIPRLFAVLVAQAAARDKIVARERPADVLRALAARERPGNVRELRNAADRFALGLDLDIGMAELDPDTSLAAQIAAHGKAPIAAAIAAHGGRRKETCEALGLSRRTLYEKMQRHGRARDDFADDR